MARDERKQQNDPETPQDVDAESRELDEEELDDVSGGTVTVSASGMDVTRKTSSTTLLSTFPDVCKTPAPGGPVPIPYPNTGTTGDGSTDTTKTKG